MGIMTAPPLHTLPDELLLFIQCRDTSSSFLPLPDAARFSSTCLRMWRIWILAIDAELQRRSWNFKRAIAIPRACTSLQCYAILHKAEMKAILAYVDLQCAMQDIDLSGRCDPKAELALVQKAQKLLSVNCTQESESYYLVACKAAGQRALRMDAGATEDGADESVVPAATSMLTQAFDRMLALAAAGDGHARGCCGATALVLSHAHMLVHSGSAPEDVEQAKDVLRRAVTVDPSHTESWIALAVSVHPDFEVGRVVLMLGLAANPTSVDLHVALAEMCIQRGSNLDEAELALRTAEELLSGAEGVNEDNRCGYEHEMQDLRTRLLLSLEDEKARD